MSILMSGLITLFIPLLAWSQAPNTATWDDLKHHVETTGEHTYTEFGVFATIESITPPDTNTTHEADYLSALGHVDLDGNYFAGEYHAVNESWVLEDDIWTIDQWIFLVGLDGRLKRAIHSEIIEDLDRRVLEYKSFKVDPAVAQDLWTDRLEIWKARVPTDSSLLNLK